MAYKIIRPRHGIKSLWNTYKSRIYKLGEMLVESPESGVGSGPVNIKFGDGVRSYENLPYAVLSPVDEVSEGVKNPVTSDAVAKAIKGVDVDIDVVDNLESTSTDLPLSANMGRQINDNISNKTTLMLRSHEGQYIAFGKDGDGNYGYYGADGSHVPFKSDCKFAIAYSASGYLNYKYDASSGGYVSDDSLFTQSGSSNSSSITFKKAGKYVVDSFECDVRQAQRTATVAYISNGVTSSLGSDLRGVEIDAKVGDVITVTVSTDTGLSATVGMLLVRTS